MPAALTKRPEAIRKRQMLRGTRRSMRKYIETIGSGGGGFIGSMFRGPGKRLGTVVEGGTSWICEDPFASDADRRWRPGDRGLVGTTDTADAGDCQFEWTDTTDATRNRILRGRDGAIERSLDGGYSWAVVKQLNGRVFGPFARIGAALFCGEGNWRRQSTSGSQGHLWRSDDDGASWIDEGIVLASSSIIGLYGGATDGLLYMSVLKVTTGDVYRRTSAGVFVAMGPATAELCLRLAGSPTSPNRVYMTEAHAVGGAATNSGANSRCWRTADITVATPTWVNISIDPADVAATDKNFSDIVCRNNGGNDELLMGHLDTSPANKAGIWLLANANSVTVVAGSWVRVTVFANCTFSWRAPATPSCKAILVDPDDDKIIYWAGVLTGSCGPMRCIDITQGVNALHVQFGSRKIGNDYVGEGLNLVGTVMGIDPSNSSRTYAGPGDWSRWRSINGGRSLIELTNVGNNPQTQDCTRIIPDPDSPQVFMMGGWRDGPCNAYGVVRSPDRGATWNPWGGGDPDLPSSPTPPQIALPGGYIRDGVYDPRAGQDRLYVTQHQIITETPSGYIAGQPGVYSRDDSLTGWDDRTGNLPATIAESLTAIILDEDRLGLRNGGVPIIYVGSQDRDSADDLPANTVGDVYKSLDLGATWTRAATTAKSIGGGTKTALRGGNNGLAVNQLNGDLFCAAEDSGAPNKPGGYFRLRFGQADWDAALELDERGRSVIMAHDAAASADCDVFVAGDNIGLAAFHGTTKINMTHQLQGLKQDGRGLALDKRFRTLYAHMVLTGSLRIPF